MSSLLSSIFGVFFVGEKEKPQPTDRGQTKSSSSSNSIATNASIKSFRSSDFKRNETNEGVMQYAKEIYEIDDQEVLQEIKERANKAIDILHENEDRRLFVEKCDNRSGEFVIDELDKVNSSDLFARHNQSKYRPNSQAFMKDLLTEYGHDLNSLKSDINDQNRKKYFEFIPVFTGQGKHKFNQYGQDSTDSSIFAGFVYDYAFNLVGKGNISEHKNNNYQEGYSPLEVDKSKQFEDLSRRYCQKVADHYGVDIKDIPQNFRELMTTDKIFKVIEKQEQEKQQAIDKRNDTQAYGPYLNLENNISHDNEINSKPHLNKGVAYEDLENKYNQAFQSKEVQHSEELKKLNQLLNKSGLVVKTFEDFRQVKKNYKDPEGTPIEEAIFSLFVKIEESKKRN